MYFAIFGEKEKLVLLKNLEGNSWSRCNFGVLGGNKIRDGGDRGGGDTLERDEGGKSLECSSLLGGISPRRLA